MKITIHIEKLTIEYSDQAPEPIVKKEPVLNSKKVPFPPVAHDTSKVAPNANKLTKKVNKSAPGAMRKATKEEIKKANAVYNKKHQLKKQNKLTPEAEAELDKTLSEITEKRKETYSFS